MWFNDLKHHVLHKVSNAIVPVILMTMACFRHNTNLQTAVISQIFSQKCTTKLLVVSYGKNVT